MEESTYRPYRPGAFFYRDGRRTTFRSLRWESGKLKLLLEQGVEEVAWEDAAEVHLPERDPWDEYVDQLAVLFAAGRRADRAVRDAGPRADHRLAEAGEGERQTSPTPSRKVRRPSGWSLDPIAIPQRLSAAQSFFDPHELPLSRFEPAAYVHRSILAGGWNQWRPM